MQREKSGFYASSYVDSDLNSAYSVKLQLSMNKFEIAAAFSIAPYTFTYNRIISVAPVHQRPMNKIAGAYSNST